MRLSKFTCTRQIIKLTLKRFGCCRYELNINDINITIFRQLRFIYTQWKLAAFLLSWTWLSHINTGITVCESLFIFARLFRSDTSYICHLNIYIYIRLLLYMSKAQVRTKEHIPFYIQQCQRLGGSAYKYSQVFVYLSNGALKHYLSRWWNWISIVYFTRLISSIF